MVNRPVKHPESPDLVLVCRANRARSPVAAELLREYARSTASSRRPSSSAAASTH